MENNETTKTEGVKKFKSSKREIAIRQKLLKKQNDYFVDIIEKLKAKNKYLSEEKQKLISENQSLKAQLNNEKNSKISAQKQKEMEHTHLMQYYNDRVIDCTEQLKAIRNIGFSRDKDKANITGRELNIVFVDGIKCRFSNHLLDAPEAKIVIETKREKDNFCLSMCMDCLQSFVYALKYISPDNSYYCDDEHGIECRCLSTFKGKRCFSCYTDNGICYAIRIHNISFSICSECKACWVMQLESTIRKLHIQNGI